MGRPGNATGSAFPDTSEAGEPPTEPAGMQVSTDPRVAQSWPRASTRL